MVGICDCITENAHVRATVWTSWTHSWPAGHFDSIQQNSSVTVCCEVIKNWVKPALSWTSATLRPNLWIACCGFPLHRCLEWWARCSWDSLLSIDRYTWMLHTLACTCWNRLWHSVVLIWVEVDQCFTCLVYLETLWSRKLHQILHQIGIKKWIGEEARIEVEYISGTRDFKTWTFAWSNELSNLISENNNL